MKELLPPYTAVMLWLPTDRADVVKVAWPLAFRVAVPSTVDPSLIVTVPEGVPEPEELTVTVNVRLVPHSIEPGADSVVVVGISAWLLLKIDSRWSLRSATSCTR